MNIHYYKFVLIISFLLSTSYVSHGQGIEFDKRFSWGQVKERAKREGKYIFVDVFATWCGPCQFMSKEVFTKSEVGNLMNEKFISLQMQVDKTKSDDDYVKSWFTDAMNIVKAYNVSAYPTMLFFNSNGELVHKIVGMRDANDFLLDAKDALIPDKQLYTQFNSFESGKRDTAFLKALSIQASKLGENEKANKIAKSFIDNLSYSEMLEKKNLQFVDLFTFTSNDKSFTLYRKAKNKINEVLGPNTVERKIRSIIGKEEIDPYLIDKDIEPDWLKIEMAVKNKYGSLGLEKVYGEQMVYYYENKNWNKFAKFYRAYFETAFSRSEYHINNLSWAIFEHIVDRTILDVAIKTMSYSIKHFDKTNYQSYDTYANLLYKVGRVKEAIDWEKLAEKALPNERWPRETLDKMKLGVPTWK